MLKFLNLKEKDMTVELALAMIEIEIENSKLQDYSCLKVLHGYGSHGKGGAILIALRNQLRIWKKTGMIIDYFSGDKWNIFDKTTQKILLKDKTIYNDEDINKSNPGITIIVLKKV